MSTALLIVTVAFAAFAVWLAVRIVNRRERWAKRTAIFLPAVLLIGYALSLGPVCWWLASQVQFPEFWVGEPIFVRAPRAYWPIGWLAKNGPRPIGDAILWYAKPHNGEVMLPTDYSGITWYDSTYDTSFRRLRSPIAG
jgi:hypothetical protein